MKQYLVLLLLGVATAAQAQTQSDGAATERFQAYMREAEMAVMEPFRGISVDGRPDTRIFSEEPSGRSDIAPITAAARAFLAGLDADQRRRVLFAPYADEWRRWSNIHRYPRQGLPLFEMNDAQRRAALRLLRAVLDARGYERAVAVMEADERLADLTSRRSDYGRNRYWFSIMGEPSSNGTWGFQVDGHHLAVNARVLGERLVVAPVFMGAEPAVNGQARLFAAEEDFGLALVRSLSDEQRGEAILAPAAPKQDVLATSFKDNLVLPYEGLRYGDLDAAQRRLLLALIRFYISSRSGPAAAVQMNLVRRHLAGTRFAWKGGSDGQAPFYYRVHGPAILIEFAHQAGTAIDDPDRVSRNQVHTVVRLPNGGDYGIALAGGPPRSSSR